MLSLPALLWLALGAGAAEPAKRAFDLSAGDAANTLKQFAVQAQREIMFPASPVAGVRTNTVRGAYTPREALDRMIEQTELTFVEDVKTGAFMVKRAPAGPAAPPIPDQQIPAHDFPTTMKRKTPIAIIASWLALVLGPSQAAENKPENPQAANAAAQQTGTLTGRISNQGTGAYLEGARVTMLPSGLSTLTDREGRYVLRHVPVGNHTLTASYTGLDSKMINLNVPAGDIAVHDLALSSGI
jgi:hypothetical protein